MIGRNQIPVIVFDSVVISTVLFLPLLSQTREIQALVSSRDAAGKVECE